MLPPQSIGWPKSEGIQGPQFFRTQIAMFFWRKLLSPFPLNPFQPLEIKTM
jgi:hypothetical protein